MHFAHGQRKPSYPANFTPRSTRNSIIQNVRQSVRLRPLLAGISIIGLLYVILSWLFSSAPEHAARFGDDPPFTKAPVGEPNVVMVTVLDDERGILYNEAIKKNRQAYAEKHGYATFMPSLTEYSLKDAPISWAKVPALRHAMTQFPKTPYFLFLDDHTLIANPSLTIEEHLTNGQRIENIAITDIPVVPPDSIIRTLRGVPGDQVDLLLAQDKDGLIVNAFLIRSGDWARYFLDAWFDPLYRSYNFQKAERHALEHIVQWHGTLLSKLALVSQDVLCTFTENDRLKVAQGGLYNTGKFIVSLPGCDEQGRSCQDEMRPWFRRLHGLNT